MKTQYQYFQLKLVTGGICPLNQASFHEYDALFLQE